MQIFQEILASITSLVLLLTAQIGDLSKTVPVTSQLAQVSQSTVVATFQQGVNGYSGTNDATISSTYYNPPSQTKGTTVLSGNMRMKDSASSNARGLMRFDNLNIPTGSVVTKATLSLTFSSYTTGYNVIGKYLNTSWNPSSSKFGWANRDDSNTWSSLGAFGEGTDLISNKSFIISGLVSGGIQKKTIDLDVSVIQNWIDNPSSNNGFLFYVDVQDKTTDIISSENAIISDRPILTITYQTNGTVPPPPPTPPSQSLPVISSFSASPSTINSGDLATLSWSVSGATAVSINNSVGDVTSLTSKSVSPTQTTTYTLTATNSSGSVTANTTVVVSTPTQTDTTAPTVPTNLSAIAVSSSQINISWTASTDAVGVVGYKIYRNGVQVGTMTSGTSYTDSGLTALTTYSYSVSAYDLAGNVSNKSSDVSATTKANQVVSGNHPSIILTPSLLNTLKVRASQNTVEWQNLANSSGINNVGCDYLITDTKGVTPDNLPPVYAPRQTKTLSVTGLVATSYEGGGYVQPVMNLSLCYLVLKDTNPDKAEIYLKQVKKILNAMTTPFATIEPQSKPAQWTFDGDPSKPYYKRPLYYVSNEGPNGQARAVMEGHYLVAGNIVTIEGVKGCVEANGTHKVGNVVSATTFDLVKIDGSPIICSAIGTNYNQNYLRDGGYGLRHYVPTLSLAFDWLYNDLEPELRNQIILTINAFVDEYRSQYGTKGIKNDSHPNSNYHFPWYESVVLASLATKGDNPRAQEIFDYWKNMHDTRDNPYFANWLQNNAGSPDAYSYMAHSAPTMMVALLAYESATGDTSLWNSAIGQWVKGLPFYFISNTLPNRHMMEYSGYVVPPEVSVPNLEPNRISIAPLWMADYIARKFNNPIAPQFRSYIDDVYAVTQAQPGDPKFNLQIGMTWQRFIFWEPNVPKSSWTSLPLSLPTMSSPTGGYGRILQRSDWSTDATFSSFWSLPYSAYAGNGKEYNDKGSLQIFNGDKTLLVHPTAESGRAKNGDAFNYFHTGAGRDYSYSLFYVERPGYVSKQWSYQSPGQNDYVKSLISQDFPAKIDRFVDKGSFTYSRAVNLQSLYNFDADLRHRPVGFWQREVVYIRPNTFVVFDETNKANSTKNDYSQYLAWSVGKYPTETTKPADGQRRFLISDGGILKGAITTVLPENVDVSINNLGGFGVVYQIKEKPTIEKGDYSWLTVIDAVDNVSSISNNKRLLSTGIEAVLINNNMTLGFRGRNKSSEISFTQESSGFVKNAIFGLAPNQSYTVTFKDISLGNFIADSQGVLSFDTNGSGLISIKIAGQIDLQPPVITNYSVSLIPIDQAKVTWNTNEITDTEIELTNQFGGVQTFYLADFTTSHYILASDIISKNYSFKIRARSTDPSGNTSNWSPYANISVGGAISISGVTQQEPPKPVVDTTSPKITGITISNQTLSSAKISWVTDELSYGQVEYGLSSSYDQLTQFTNIASTNTSFTLNSLSPNSTYHFRVKSKDSSGNISSSADFTFNTLTSQDSVPPDSITNLTVGEITQSSAGLSFTSTGDNQKTGTASYYDIRYNNVVITDNNWKDSLIVSGEPVPKIAGTNQNYTLVGLLSDNTYFVAMKVVDAVGNASPISNVISFKTLKSVIVNNTGSDGSSSGQISSGGGSVSGSGSIVESPKISNVVFDSFDGQTSISWVNPNNSSFIRTLIVRKEGSYPTSPSDGIKIYEGTASSFVDTSLTNGKTYYYSVFPVLISGVSNISSKNFSSVPQKDKTQINNNNNSTTFIAEVEPEKYLNNLTIINRNLYRSVKGEDVKILQQFLINQGFLANGNITGFFGILTEEAVKKFQKSKNIVSDGNAITTGYGVVGIKTRSIINSIIQSSSNNQVLNREQIIELIAKLIKQVNELQIQLNKIKGL